MDFYFELGEKDANKIAPTFAGASVCLDFLYRILDLGHGFGIGLAAPFCRVEVDLPFRAIDTVAVVLNPFMDGIVGFTDSGKGAVVHSAGHRFYAR